MCCGVIHLSNCSVRTADIHEERGLIIHFRLPPLVVPPWPFLTVCHHGQRVALPDKLSHTARAVFTRRPQSCHVLSRHTQRVYRPAGRDLEHHASRYTCGFLTLHLNLDQCARGWSSCISKASYIEAIFKSFTNISDPSLVRCFMPKSQECFRRDLLHHQLVFADRLLKTTGTESRCALPCPSPFCLLWTVLHSSQCAAELERLCPVFGKRLP